MKEHMPVTHSARRIQEKSHSKREKMTIQLTGLKIQIQKRRTKSKFLTKEEIPGIPARYESYFDESITLSRHILGKSCCRPDLPKPRVIPGISCVNQPLRREEAIIQGYITK